MNPIGYRVRYLCPEEGPSIWQLVLANDIKLYLNAPEYYEVQELVVKHDEVTTPFQEIMRNYQ